MLLLYSYTIITIRRCGGYSKDSRVPEQKYIDPTCPPSVISTLIHGSCTGSKSYVIMIVRCLRAAPGLPSGIVSVLPSSVFSLVAVELWL